MRLEIDHRKVVADVMKQLYGTNNGDLATFLATLGKTLADITKDDKADNVRWAVIDSAERQEWIIELVEKLHEVAPPNAKASLEALGTIEELKAASFYDEVFAKGEPLVNRKTLRGKLRSAAGEHARRILVVKGDRYSGKSHAVRHIRYVCTKLGIPLADFALREYATGEEVRPFDFGQAIADAIGKPLPQNLDAKASRWSLNFLNWLGSQVDPMRDRLWIVFDDFEQEKLKVALPESAYEFIQMLAERVADRLPGVRLFLINYDRELPTEVSFHLDEEKVPPDITEEDLTFFFLDYYSSYRPDTSPAAAATDAVNRARAVLGKMDADKKKRLDSMRKALRSEVDSILEGQP
jgi:hypothetical protein